jgi:hypothetical protein
MKKRDDMKKGEEIDRRERNSAEEKIIKYGRLRGNGKYKGEINAE